LAYSQGFNPRPKLQLAAALPLGHTSEAELLDVWLEKPMLLRNFTKALVPVLSNGLMVHQVRQVNMKDPALQTQIKSAEYHATIEGWDRSTEQIEARIERILAATELPQERRGRQYDLRPLIERLWLEQVEGNKVVLGMQLAAREGATARPEAVLVALEMDNALIHYHRRELIRTTDNQ
jgi:radical SAM-linked protein